MEDLLKVRALLRAVYERRNTQEIARALDSDLAGFIRASGCRVDVRNGAPLNETLIHIFGIGLNTVLGLLNVRKIAGANWDYTYDMQLGFISMTSRPAARIAEDCAAYTNGVGYVFKPTDGMQARRLGIPILPARDLFTIYRGTTPYSCDIMLNLANRAGILNANGVTGELRLVAMEHVFEPTDVAENTVLMNNGAADPVRYRLVHSNHTDRAFTLNNRPIVEGRWTSFDTECVVATAGAWTGGITIEFRIVWARIPAPRARDPAPVCFERATVDRRISASTSIREFQAGTTPYNMFETFKQVIDVRDAAQLGLHVESHILIELAEVCLLLQYLTAE